MSEKVNFSKEFCFLREKRKYLHSTDIFGQIISLKKIKKITNLKITFKKKIKHLPYLIINKNLLQKNNSQSFVNFRFKVNKILYFGYVFQSKKKLINKKEYIEKEFQKKIKFYKNNVNIPRYNKMNFIEQITSAAMKFLKKISPEIKTKWYLVILNLRNFIKKKNYKNLTLISMTKSKKIILFNITSCDKKIGDMLFVKK
jgi:hypothetical protein